jgi:serine/threonine protein kinase
MLVDFGIAAADGHHPTGTDDGDLVVGSPAYMAPELVRGQRPGPAADLWSLGATLYTAVEGRPPFPHQDPAPTLAAVLLDPPSPTLLAGPLGPLLGWLLAKDPAGRPSHHAAHTLLLAAHPSPPAHRSGLSDTRCNWP